VTTKRFFAKDSDLDLLYADVAEHDLQPLWLLENLMPNEPSLSGPHAWRAKELRALMERAGELVTIDRGGDRRVLGLANPHLGDAPYATTTLWGAVQYLRPGEIAPAHRHSPGALRFVIEGSGVWTQVDGDAVSMGPGDLVLTPPWTWHEHHNSGESPMIWFDGLDLPLVRSLDAVFFERGPDIDVERNTPGRSDSEATFAAGPGLVPVEEGPGAARNYSPLFAYRREQTDAALTALVARAGGGPAALRFVDPTSGKDVMATMRCEMHRIPAHTETVPTRVVGSSILVVYEGAGTAVVGEESFTLEPGDILSVPSFARWSFLAAADTDLFRVSDAPVLEALGLDQPRWGGAAPR
jgi:gentisate 1,2-dioxygenase